MKKIILCLLLLGLVSTSQVASASQMNSEVGIEFSKRVAEDKKEEEIGSIIPKQLLPKTGEINEYVTIYSFFGLAIFIFSLFLIIKFQRKREAKHE